MAATELTNLLGLTGAGALLIAGVILIARSSAARGEMLAQRIGLARLPSPAEAPLPPAWRLAPKRASSPGPRNSTQQAREIARLFSIFGLRPEAALAVYRIGRPAIALGIGIVAFLVALPLIPAPASVAMLFAAVAALVAWLVPPALLARRIRRHATLAAAGLPDALELLVVCIEAGLSLDDGIDRVVIELRQSQPALAEELALTSADWKILPNREQALANLASRVDVPSVHALVTTLSQTLRYGTPVMQAMRNVATELRNDALLRIEERANQLPVLLTIPMMLFIMPTIFLIVAGPAALRIFDLFLRGKFF